MTQQVRIIDLKNSYLPVDPNTYSPNILSDSMIARGDELPVSPYDGYNFMPTEYGYRSFFGDTEEYKADPLPRETDGVVVFQNIEYLNFVIALSSDGIRWRVKDSVDDTSWHFQEGRPVEEENPGYYPWTYTILDNKLFCYQQQAENYWVFYFDPVHAEQHPDFDPLDPIGGYRPYKVVPTFLNMAGQVGIFRAGARLAFWDSANAIATSSVDDLSDFTPSVSTLADVVVYSQVQGRITTVKPMGEGFIIYAAQNIVAVARDLSADLTWRGTVIHPHGVLYPRQIVAGERDEVHYVISTSEILHIQAAQCSPILPDFNTMLRRETKPFYVTLYGQRYLVFLPLDSWVIRRQRSTSSRFNDTEWVINPGESLGEYKDPRLSPPDTPLDITELPTEDLCRTLDSLADCYYRPMTRIRRLYCFGGGADKITIPSVTIEVPSIGEVEIPESATIQYGTWALNPEFDTKEEDDLTINSEDLQEFISRDAASYAGILHYAKRQVQEEVKRFEKNRLKLKWQGSTPLYVYKHHETGVWHTHKDVDEVTEEVTTEALFNSEDVPVITDYTMPFTEISCCGVRVGVHTLEQSTFKLKGKVLAWKDTPGEKSQGFAGKNLSSVKLKYRCIVGDFDTKEEMWAALEAHFDTLNDGPYHLDSYDHTGSWDPAHMPESVFAQLPAGSKLEYSDVYKSANDPTIWTAWGRMYLECIYEYTTKVNAQAGDPTKFATWLEWEPEIDRNRRGNTITLKTFGSFTQAYETAYDWDGPWTPVESSRSECSADWRTDWPLSFSDFTSKTQGSASSVTGNPAVNDAEGTICGNPIYLPDTPWGYLEWDEIIGKIPGGGFTLVDGSNAPAYPRLEGAYVFDTQLKRWGKLQRTFYAIFDVVPINRYDVQVINSFETLAASGVLGHDGKIKLFTGSPKDSKLRIGKVGFSRKGFTDAEEVIAHMQAPFQKSYEIPPSIIQVEPSIDGERVEDSMVAWAHTDELVDYPVSNATRSQVFRMPVSLSARWYNIVFIGKYDISYLEFRGTSAGRR